MKYPQRPPVPTVIALLVLFISTTVLAEKEQTVKSRQACAEVPRQSLVSCRALTDAMSRLACYDAIDISTTGTALGQAGVSGPNTPSSQTTEVDRDPISRAAADLATSAFGLPALRGAEVTASVASRIVGRFEGWGPSTRVRLANGQIWQVIEDSRGSYELSAPEVRVKRGLLGSFFMEIDGVSAVLRVRRVD